MSSYWNSKLTPLQLLSHRKYSKSLINKANNTGDKFSPCLTPQKLEKKEDCSPLYETHDLIPLYMLKIIWKHFPLILLANSYFHSPTRHTESNALLKSINEQNNLFFWVFAISVNACKQKYDPLLSGLRGNQPDFPQVYCVLQEIY